AAPPVNSSGADQKVPPPLGRKLRNLNTTRRRKRRDAERRLRTEPILRSAVASHLTARPLRCRRPGAGGPRLDRRSAPGPADLVADAADGPDLLRRLSLTIFFVLRRQYQPTQSGFVGRGGPGRSRRRGWRPPARGARRLQPGVGLQTPTGGPGVGAVSGWC